MLGEGSQFNQRTGRIRISICFCQTAERSECRIVRTNELEVSGLHSIERRLNHELHITDKTDCCSANSHLFQAIKTNASQVSARKRANSLCECKPGSIFTVNYLIETQTILC